MGAAVQGNYFLDSLGPQSPDAQPEQMSTGPGPAAMDHYAQQQAEQTALRMGLHQVIRQNFNDAGLGLAQTGAKGLGTGIKAGVDALRRGASTYVSGGPTTLSSSSFSTLSVLGKVAGTAAAAYGAYEGVNKGLRSANELNSELRGSTLSEEEQQEIRDKHVASNLTQAGAGAGTGALAGAALGGPFGAVIGGVLGGAGGALGATRTFKDDRTPIQSTARSIGRFLRNPLKR